MKKITRLTFYIVLFSIILGACGRKDKEDAGRLTQLKEQIEHLYNEEQNDLAEDLSTEQFSEVEEAIQAEQEEEFNEENQETFEKLESSYFQAVTLYELEEAIQELFVDEIITKEVEFEDVEQLSTRLAEVNAEKWTHYVHRQKDKLTEVEEQLEQIKIAQELVKQFYLEGDRVNREASREDENVAKEAVAQVKNEEIREELEKRLEKVDQTLAKVEEEKRVAAEKAAKSIGNFAGQYHDSNDNYLVIVTEDTFEGFVPHSGVFFDYEIREVIHNSGKELSLILHHEEYDGGGLYIPERTAEELWVLSDDGNYLYTQYFDLRRVSDEEFEKIRNPFDMDY